MPEVGIRELRDHLSRYVNRVREGDEVTITDHGKAVARIIPIDHPRRFDELIERGLVTPASSSERSLPTRRVKATGSVSELAGDQSE
jgi:prevent-host-death family protein